MSDVIPFPQPQPPVFTDAMMEKLEGMNDVLRMDVVNSAIKEIKHLRRLNQQYFDAITRLTQDNSVVFNNVYSAKMAIHNEDMVTAQKYLTEILVLTGLPSKYFTDYNNKT